IKSDTVEWFLVIPTGDHTWNRKIGSYFVEYSLVPEECRGPVVILSTGEIYLVDSDFRMTTPKGEFIPFTCEHFPEFQDEDNDGVNDNLPGESKSLEFKKPSPLKENDPNKPQLLGSSSCE
ncbi:MAG: hypothetical protein ACKO96_36960, partial [Flammeovirgaceae bacterium]